MNIIAIMASRRLPPKTSRSKNWKRRCSAVFPGPFAAKQRRPAAVFIEHNLRICGVIFDRDEYSVDPGSDINQLTEYLLSVRLY
ncbi:hypothetical protein MJ561_05945 [Klebsiella pneumoniae]|nr:hypothetical protein MJ561_05945 [Klebsiella pneumoniae]